MSIIPGSPRARGSPSSLRSFNGPRPMRGAEVGDGAPPERGVTVALVARNTICVARVQMADGAGDVAGRRRSSLIAAGP